MFVLCVVSSVKDHRNSLHSSPLLEKTSVRQVVLDKWLPLKSANRQRGVRACVRDTRAHLCRSRTCYFHFTVHCLSFLTACGEEIRFSPLPAKPNLAPLAAHHPDLPSRELSFRLTASPQARSINIPGKGRAQGSLDGLGSPVSPHKSKSRNLKVRGPNPGFIGHGNPSVSF